MAVYSKKGMPITLDWVRLRSYVNAKTGCWEWALSRLPRPNADYGVAGLCSKRQGAHRFAWEIANDQLIPEDKEVHHTCYVPCCVNPGHLELVTPAQNKSLRRPGHRRLRTSPTCQRGHALTEDNWFTRPNGRRECRKCKNLAGQRYHYKKRRRLTGPMSVEELRALLARQAKGNAPT